MRAAEVGTWAWIDMEGSAYVEGTIAFYERARAAHDNVGLCLQAYLHRTPADVQRLLPLKPGDPPGQGRLRRAGHDRLPTRGATSTPPSWRSRRRSRRPSATARPGSWPGTHDVELIEQIARFGAAIGLEPARIEIEMLYGIRADQQRKLAARGFDVRCLIAYGEHWYPWYMRRLAERPANVVFALRQILPW